VTGEYRTRLRPVLTVSSSDILDGDVLDVETDVVSGKTLGDLLVVHLDGLDFGGDVGGGEGDDHTGLNYTSLNSANGDCADTTCKLAEEQEYTDKTHRSCKRPGGAIGGACR